ncbi:TetR family transcriptional regulator [Streptomyces sp. NPDC005438]|uniref:TetR/AcrR family transcriptional regulator n=1 Tax=Streptomyces sp. NPDC005438 TaxID=3156880 RepID=UPI0033AF56C6
MARRHDPRRRERIIDAAMRLIASEGLAGLSHRTVAAEADVPLGSTTYHFASLDELLVAALRRVAEEQRGDSAWTRHLDPGVPLEDGLLALLEEWCEDPARLRLEYDLYLAALRRPALRPVAASWLDDMVELLSARTGDPALARALVALTDGLMLQHLLTGRPLDREVTRETLGRLVGARTVG